MSSSDDLQGDTDPQTGYKYEPKPFIDRVHELQVDEEGNHITIISNVWGDYSASTWGKFKKPLSKYLYIMDTKNN